MNCMRFIKSLVAGLLLTGALAMLPDTSFARGGGGGWHFGGGGHFGGFHSGFAGRGFAQSGRFNGAWHHGSYASRHGYGGYYGYYGPFYYGPYDYGDYGGLYSDDDGSFDVQAAPSDAVPEDSAALIMSLQKELAQLRYYHGPIDGIAGPETERAVRWFQSVDKLPLTGRIDSATLKALQIG